MPSRAFNLDELLGEKYVRHYLRFLQDSGKETWVAPDGDDPDRFTTLPERPGLPDQAIRHGTGAWASRSGPAGCS